MKVRISVFTAQQKKILKEKVTWQTLRGINGKSIVSHTKMLRAQSQACFLTLTCLTNIPLKCTVLTIIMWTNTVRYFVKWTTWYFGWLPHSGKHNFVVLSYFLCFIQVGPWRFWPAESGFESQLWYAKSRKGFLRKSECIERRLTCWHISFCVGLFTWIQIGR